MTDIQPRAHTAVQTPLHANTPAVNSPHRSLVLLRTPEEGKARILVTRTVADPFTRTSRLYGARKLINSSGTVMADAVTVTALSGQPLSLHTADGDGSLTLNDAAGRPLWSRNAQGTVTTVQYEDAGEGGRPAFLTETVTGIAEGRVRERYGYHPLTDEAVRARNLAGALAEHYDNAGVTRPLSVSLSGQLLASEQQLLKPEAGEADWPVPSGSSPDLEAPLTVSGTYDATGAPLAQTNAAGVTTVSAYDIRGAVSETRLQYQDTSGQQDIITLKDILYRADGVVLSQVAGNGVTEKYTYDPQTQYLTRHTVSRPDTHPQGILLISDLHYTCDPAGNIIFLEDKGTDPVWYNNRRVTGLREYTYDSLYRLISATGRERHPVDPDNPAAGYTWSPYTERYTYDDGDNLTQTTHTGGSGSRTVTMVVSESSNRAVKKPDGSTTPDPDAGFLAGGLQKQLSDGRELLWYADNQLRQVSPVVRTGEGEQDDTERYHYADGGTRTRKIRTAKTSGDTQTCVTTYAGGTETRQRRLSGQEKLQLDIVITEGSGVRLIHNRLTGEVHLRYSFSDHLGSTGGETDVNGKVTSREEYLPYGGSAGSVEEAEEIHDRTRRYSGKERDATGLLYYGWRYYQPETGRWLSADPGGLIDGINLFRFCRNNPLNRADIDGRNDTETDRINSLLRENYKNNVKIRILERREKNREEAMLKLGLIFSISGQELGETLQKIIDYIDDAPRSINVKYSALPNFTDGYMKNTFATKTRTGNLSYINKRIGRNRELINFDTADNLLKSHHEHSFLGMGMSGEINPVSHAAHPVHGSIQMQSLEPAQGGAYYEEYGESALFLNPESDSFNYLTYTPQDSMFFYICYQSDESTFSLPEVMAVRENMYPLIRYATEEQIQYYYDVAINNEAGKPALKPYIEWQAHSRLNIGTDVHKLYVSENEKPKGIAWNTYKTNKAVKAFAHKHNIAIIN